MLAGYLRVSHVGRRKIERLQSPAEQTAEIEVWAKARGYSVDILPAELDAKGSDADRPILRRAVEGVKDGRYEGVVVAYLSRAGRDLRLMLDLWEEVEGAGGAVYFARENIDGSTPSGRLQRNLLASIAQHELEERREGFERATQGAVERGIWSRRQTPRGYSKDPDTRRLVPDERADGVREAARDFLAGVSVVKIADRLGMTPGGVRALLRNRVYLGELKVRSYVNPSAHQPILDPGTFAAVQEKLGSRARAPRRASIALLAGIIRCASCGHVMGRGNSGGEPAYGCPTHHSGERCPRPAFIAAGRVEGYVEAIALEQLDRLSVSRSAGGEATDAQESLAAAEAELSGFLEAVEVAGVGSADAAAAMKSRREKVDAAEERLQRVLAKAPQLPAIEGGAAAWGALNPAQRNTLLSSLLAAVAVRAVGAGKRVPVADRVRVFSSSAELNLPGGRTGSAGGIVPLPWPDPDGVDVLGVVGAQ